MPVESPAGGPLRFSFTFGFPYAPFPIIWYGDLHVCRDGSGIVIMCDEQGLPTPHMMRLNRHEVHLWRRFMAFCIAPAVKMRIPDPSHGD